jgi:hypothetical protein
MVPWPERESVVIATLPLVADAVLHADPSRRRNTSTVRLPAPALTATFSGDQRLANPQSARLRSGRAPRGSPP